MEDKVILYHKDGCPQCMMVEVLLKKQGVTYEDCKDLDYMMSLGIQHLPVLSVNGNLLVGQAIVEYIKGLRG